MPLISLDRPMENVSIKLWSEAPVEGGSTWIFKFGNSLINGISFANLEVVDCVPRGWCFEDKVPLGGSLVSENDIQSEDLLENFPAVALSYSDQPLLRFKAESNLKFVDKNY